MATGLKRKTASKRAVTLRAVGFQLQLFATPSSINDPTRPIGKPTRYAPGSVERLRVYRERAERGEPVLNPLDSNYETSKQSTRLASEKHIIRNSQ